MNILEVKNLSKTFDNKNNVLNNCNFTLEKGKICAIVGESGSGKSTLFRLISGLERPNTGEIIINGQVMSSDTKVVSPQKRAVGMVFQDFALFPHLTVAKNISYGMKEVSKESITALLKTIKMENYGNRYPKELSGGQQQRVALARTLATSPALLLLDEPFSNIDSELKSELRHEIKTIVKDLEKSMLFITHDIFDALDIADEIIFINDGLIIRHSSIKDVYKDVKDQNIKKSMLELKSNAERILNAISNK